MIRKSIPLISSTPIKCSREHESRRTFIATTTIGLLLSNARPAVAVRDFARVGLLGGSNVIDVNNANIRVYLKMDGMYPNIARKIVMNGPYESVKDIFNIPELSEKEKEVIRRHESRLTATKPSPEYFIDRVNNGLYR